MYMKSLIVVMVFCLPLILAVDSSAGDWIVAEAATERGGVCPDGIDIGHELVERYLSSPGYADARQEAGTSGISPDEIRLLVDGQDDEACEALNATYGQYRNGRVRDVAYYEAGGFYFVAHPLTEKEVDGMYIASGHHFFHVVNSEFERVKGHMM
jgi:hypothetical protein